MNGKMPRVYRDYSGGLTGKSALKWCRFLAEEADFEGDNDSAKQFKNYIRMMETVLPAAVHSTYLEERISKYAQA